MNESMNGNRNTFAMLNDVVHAMVENDKSGLGFPRCFSIFCCLKDPALFLTWISLGAVAIAAFM
jgi:hypothetical protein